MKKVNVKVIIADLLKKLRSEKVITKVSTDYPSHWEFPIVIYRTSAKPHVIDFHKNELQTEWTITLEIYGGGSLTEITERINQEFNKIGFLGSSEDAHTADRNRVICKFIAVVDNVTKYVYQK